jgi:hypothetical protein
VLSRGAQGFGYQIKEWFDTSATTQVLDHLPFFDKMIIGLSMSHPYSGGITLRECDLSDSRIDAK